MYHKKLRTFQNNKIVNLSSKKLTYYHLSVLNKGLTFVPVNYKCNKNNLQDEVRRFERRLQLHAFFEQIKQKNAKNIKSRHKRDSSNVNKDSNEPIPFTKNPNFWPPNDNANISVFCHNLKVDLFNMHKIPPTDNMTKKERLALQELRTDSTITIKKGDKGAGFVILDSDAYVNKINDQLRDTETYTIKDKDDTTLVKSQADYLVNKLYNAKYLTYKQRRYLTNFKAKTPKFYGIPKIHKKDNPLRPIVSQIDGPTSKINELTDFYLSTAEKSIPYLLQDTTAFLHIIDKFNTEYEINEHTYLISLDVTSLYTNIPQIEGATWVSEYYEETINLWTNPVMPLIPKELLYECIIFILTNTTFQFNDKLYHQNFGTTMGARVSVKFANIYMHKLLSKFRDSYTGHKPDIIARLVDDLFMVWNTDINTINNFIHALNSFHPNIKFTSTISTTELQYLDTVVYKQDNKLHTKIFNKPTDCKQYLHYTSNHPQHTKLSIPYSQAIRYRRNISDDNELKVALESLKTKFIDRGYPEDIIHRQINKVFQIPRINTLTYKTKQEKRQRKSYTTDTDTFIPLIVTFHPNYLNKTSESIHKYLNNNWNEFLEDNKELKNIFKNTTIRTVFKKDLSLSQLLTSSTHPPKWHKQIKDTINEEDDDIINLLALFLSENEAHT